MFGALLLFEDEFIHVVAISFTALILTELIMVALTIRTWHWMMALAELVSFVTYIVAMMVLRDLFGESRLIESITSSSSTRSVSSSRPRVYPYR